MKYIPDKYYDDPSYCFRGNQKRVVILVRCAALFEDVGPDQPSDSPPTTTNLILTANRLRQHLRPEESQDLNFDIDLSFIPLGFLQKDVTIEGARHLIFYTSQQTEVLSQSKSWYVDATFKIVHKPFYQMFLIHTFMKGPDGNVKQVPLVFVLMSRRERKDYKKVLKAIKRLVPNLRVEKLVMDFEVGLWRAVSSTFPGTSIQGCCFHLTQAVWRKVQQLGLQVPFMENRATHNFIKQLMALPFHPAEHIED
ncbi:uncharacterized protein LOC144445397 [Glandiceps talaboti]